MNLPRLFIGSDHAGFEAKENLKKFLEKNYSDLDVIDEGPVSAQSVDYPDYADRVCTSMTKSTDRGILICGSGQGMAMRANKYNHIRAALCWNEEVAQLCRNHNDANILCLGARLQSENQMEHLTRTFLDTEFEGGRHQQRVDKIASALYDPRAPKKDI